MIPLPAPDANAVNSHNRVIEDLRKQIKRLETKLEGLHSTKEDEGISCISCSTDLMQLSGQSNCFFTGEPSS